MKTIDFNINQSVKVKLTDFGRKVYRDGQIEFWTSVGKPEQNPVARDEDAEGWSRWTMWELMRAFGSHMRICGKLVFETNIKVEVGEP